jgi:hypothetical protein
MSFKADPCFYMMFFNKEKGYHQVLPATPEVLRMERRELSSSTLKGLTGNYDDFYEIGLRAEDEVGDGLVDESNLFRLLSTNHEKLKGFCGWINRIFT